MRARRLAILFALWILPLTSLASIVISEVMYDVAGADGDHEWIEIINTGNSPTDLSSYKLFEGGVNHKLTIVRGSATLAPSAVAIIADNAGVFASDHPEVTAALFDSSFTSGLSNTGETLVIRTGALVEEDSATYSAPGGSGEGTLSLARGSTGTFVAGTPTPGVYEGNPIPRPAPLKAVETAPLPPQLHTAVLQTTEEGVRANKAAEVPEVGVIEARGEKEDTEPLFLVWVLGAVGLCIMGAGAVIALEMQSKASRAGGEEDKKADIQKEAESYEIIES